MNEIIERILQLMKKNNLSAKKTTEILGVSSSTISDWKSGRIKPSIEHIIKLSKLFNVTTDYLLTGFDRELPPDERLTVGYDHKGNVINLSEEQEAYLKQVINQTLNERVEAIKKEVMKEIEDKKG